MYKKLKMWIRFFFGFSRTEANGFVVLSLLMLFFLVLPLFTKHLLFSSNKVSLDIKQSSLLDSLIAQLDAAVEEEDIGTPRPLFDINNISAAELENYGLPQYLAGRIVKYRQQVKPFSSKQELLKIYGLDSVNYNKLYPYLLEISQQPTLHEAIPSAKNNNYNGVDYQQAILPKKDRVIRLLPFNINTADTIRLKKVYGIGPAFAKRIVAYRDLLGGFHDLKQLEEVYGLKGPALDSLLTYATIERQLSLKIIAINMLEVKDLSKHPYVNYKQAKVIVAYRMLHGNYAKASDLLQIGILDSAFVEKLSPYLHFGE